MEKLRKLIFTAFKKGFKLFSGRGLNKIPLVWKTYCFLYRHIKPAHGIILTEIQGHKMWIDTEEMGFFLCLLLNDEKYEECETRLFEKLVKPEMVVLDIGAHIGYYTLIAADLVGKNGKVFAFEPAPDNYALLVKNIEVNGYKNIIPTQKAVSNKTGTTKLFLDPDCKGAHRIYDCRDKKEHVIVNLTTLDEFFKYRDGRINIIKMDVEGAEMGVLQGMTNLIKKNIDLKIFAEFCPALLRKFGASPEEFLSRLVEYGFRLYKIDEMKKTVNTVSVTQVLRECGGTKVTNLLCEKG